MTLFDREGLYDQLEDLGAGEWAGRLRTIAEETFRNDRHGNLEAWKTVWSQLPSGEGTIVDASSSHVTVRSANPDTSPLADREQLTATLMKFHPWRKGPFHIFDVEIDTEWRSDWKWNRLIPHVSFRDRRVLDVGCGNGYYGWRIQHAGARLVCGLDPFLLYVMQYEVIRRFADTHNQHYILPVGDNVLPERLRLFDTVVSMGVLYHRTSPVDHLLSLRSALRPGGQLILETLIIDQKEESVLVPHDRYAMMRNVWFIPSISMLLKWLQRTGFRNCEVIDVTETTPEEQRKTEWMTFDSLPDFLDPSNQKRTIEGYPGPRRAMITANIL